MAKPPAAFLPLIGSAVAVSIMVLLYYEKRRNDTDENDAENKKQENATIENQSVPDGDGVKASARKQGVKNDVTPSSSRTSYTSFDEEEMKSCKSVSSSTSAYSTASDDNDTYPVGEYITYNQHEVAQGYYGMDLHEILNSPIVEEHFMDERMRRLPTQHGDTQEHIFSDTDAHMSEVDSTNIKSIVVTYDDIVPPLKPNTGETIQPSNIPHVH